MEKRCAWNGHGRNPLQLEGLCKKKEIVDRVASRRNPLQLEGLCKSMLRKLRLVNDLKGEN